MEKGEDRRMIYTQFVTPKANPTPAGSRYIKTYQEQLSKKGNKELVVTGKHDVYAEIQLDAESCKIENILHAVAMGDLAALNQREATYCDCTTMPKTLLEAQNLVIKAKDEFYKMPIEVRKEFNNDPDQYVTEMGTNEFLEKMAPYNEKLLAISKEKNDKEYRKKVQEGAKLNLDIEREMAAQKGVTNEQK